MGLAFSRFGFAFASFGGESLSVVLGSSRSLSDSEERRLHEEIRKYIELPLPERKI